MQPFMFTMPQIHGWKRMLKIMLQKFDIHDYVFGLERGKSGYRHIQGRVHVSGDPNDFFTWCQNNIGMHIEKCQPIEVTNYERKEGHFWASRDTNQIRSVRFGEPNEVQRRVLRALKETNDRELCVWLDTRGAVGKSWLCSWLFETGRAHYVIPYASSVSSMVQDVASAYLAEWRPIVVVDIPRSWKWTVALLVALESIKDGLIKDPRYNSRSINIRGVKVLILTNQKPKLDALSDDRWKLLDRDGHPLS